MSKFDEFLEKATVRLPFGWRWARLGDVCAPKTGTCDPRQAPEDTFRYIDISSVDNITKRIIQAKELRGSDAPSRARQIVRQNDVVVATTRPNLNAVAFVPTDLNGAVCSTGFCVLRATDLVEPQFLFAYVQSETFVKSVSDLVKGALYPAVTDGQVKGQYIPLPPLHQQKRIVSILNEQMAQVERARAAAEEQLRAARELPAAFLRAVFEGEEAKTWPAKRLGSLLRLRKDIVHPRNEPHGPATFVGLEHVQSQTGQRIGGVAVEMADLTGRKPRFYAGDIVYGYLRPYLNKVWLADFDGLCSVDQYVYAVDKDCAEAEFVAWFMRSSAYLSRAPINAGPGQLPRIRTEEVASVEINLPPLETQRVVVAHLEEVMNTARRAIAASEERLRSVNALPAELLACAFRGELAVARLRRPVPKAVQPDRPANPLRLPSTSPREKVELSESDTNRAALLAYFTNKQCDEQDYGRTKEVKLLYFATAHLGLPIGGEWERAKYGPFDEAIYKMERFGRAKQWFSAGKRKKGKTHSTAILYRRSRRIREGIDTATALLGNKQAEMDRVISLFAPFGKEETELIATAHSAWNDLMIDGETPTNDEIIRQVRENWHPSKVKFSPDKIVETIQWLRANDMVPRGIGPRTKAPVAAIEPDAE